MSNPRGTLLAYMRQSLPNSSWQVGITNDIERRRSEHGITEDDLFVFILAKTPLDAKNIERFFCEQVGTRGGIGGSEEGQFVYAFKKLVR